MNKIDRIRNEGRETTQVKQIGESYRGKAEIINLICAEEG